MASIFITAIIALLIYLTISSATQRQNDSIKLKAHYDTRLAHRERDLLSTVNENTAEIRYLRQRISELENSMNLLQTAKEKAEDVILTFLTKI